MTVKAAGSYSYRSDLKGNIYFISPRVWLKAFSNVPYTYL
jgi:YHS domain-containing protein